MNKMLPRLGIFYKQLDTPPVGEPEGAYVYQLTDHLGNVRAVIAKSGSDAAISSSTDYYPGGMAMPNRNIVGDYRYNYQGQELDQETGKVAFQLRLYDPRINRWLTTDPKGEFASPYLAMGNNWTNKIDPDGGHTEDDYTLHKDGTLSVVRTDDKFDRLFVEGKEGFDVINDQSILSSLFDTQFSGVSMATVGAGSKEDLFKVFETVATNSSPEWRIIRSTKNKYILGTQFNPDYSSAGARLYPVPSGNRSTKK